MNSIIHHLVMQNSILVISENLKGLQYLDFIKMEEH